MTRIISASVRKILLAAVLCTLLPIFAWGVARAVGELETEMDRVRASGAGDSNELTEKLKIAQNTISEGKQYIASLDSKILELEKEKTDLKQIQTTLTSGLIGAVVTAIVAIVGVVMKTFGSRAEKDLKRLEVIEKVAALREKKVGIPDDILHTYKADATRDIAS